VKRQNFRIKTVTFRSNIELKPYTHAHIEVSVDVPPNTKPEAALEFAKSWVAKELKIAKDGNRQPTGRFLSDY
jgi:hypothetical protein